MTDVELLCEKSFSGADQEIVDKFVEFQVALIEANIDELNEILLDDFKFTQIPRITKTKEEFMSELTDGTMDYSKSDIMDPTILFDDDSSASLISKVRLTAKISGKELRWISNTVANFKKVGDVWHIVGWEN